MKAAQEAAPRGAQLARRFAVRCMEARGHPPASDVSCAIALVVGELAANAVQHGRVPGRDFGLRLTLDEVAGLVRVEAVGIASTPPDGTSAGIRRSVAQPPRTAASHNG